MAKLTRSNNKVIGGVCAGVAEAFGLDAKLVRIVWLIAVLFGGIGGLLYVLLWLLLPAKK
jgi:phage shock protein PspC (stress-responsive transcriptional regulator)